MSRRKKVMTEIQRNKYSRANKGSCRVVIVVGLVRHMALHPEE
jgi:hypothetical protein